jgi:HEAT repeat protein
MRTRLALVALLAAAAVPPALPAAAQEEPGGAPPPRRKGERPVFGPPEKGPEEEGEPKPGKPEEPPKTPAQLLIALLAQWPSAEARAAADRAAVDWTAARPAILQALQGTPPPDPRVVAASAHAARRAADASLLDPLLATLRDARVHPWAGDLVDAVLELDPVGGKERLLPLLATPSSSVVDRVGRALQPILVPADAPRLHALARARFPATRRAALSLASQADFEASREVLVAALGDASPEAALVAATILGGRGDAEMIATLNESVRGADSRRGAYAVIALAVAGERAGAPVIDGPAQAALLGSRGLRSGDPLLRAAAAVALADAAYRKPDEVLDALLETEVVPALLEVVAGTRFFPDLIAVKPFVTARLRRLCPGTESLQTAPDWSRWWEGRRRDFVARRALTALPASRRGFRVRVEGASAGGAGPCVYASSAADAPPAGGAGGRFVALSPEETETLARAVETSGVLALPETGAPEEAPAALALSIEAGNRGRTLRVAEGTEAPEALRSILEVLAGIRERNLWQSYWDRRIGPTFAAFVEFERPHWDGRGTPEARETRLARLAVASLAALEEEDRAAALRALEGNGRLADAIRGDEASALASFLALGERLGGTGEAAARVLAAAGRTEALPHLAARLEGASPADRGRLEALLEATFERVPLPAALDAAGGTGPILLRAAAIRALGARADEPRAAEAARAAASHGEPLLRAAGYRALGRLRPADGLTVLKVALEGETDPAARAGLLEGLGAIGGPETIPLLGRETRSPDPRLRAAAVRGLAATREPGSLAWVLPLLGSDPDPAVQEEADRALGALGGERGREALRAIAFDARQPRDLRIRAADGLSLLGLEAARGDLRALLADADAEVADAAAFALAWQRDGEAAPRVLEALRAGRSPARAARSIELLSLESFASVRDRSEAIALYTGWYEVSRARGPRGWLAEALRQRGHGGEGLADFESGAQARAAVPALLKALRDPSWAMRRAAALELERIAGREFGDLGPWTPEARNAAVAGAWEAWWESERGSGR